jgi:hypothetical protein
MMNKLVLGAAVVAFGALSTPAAFAQDMTVTSAEVSEGSAIKDAQYLLNDVVPRPFATIAAGHDMARTG